VQLWAHFFWVNKLCDKINQLRDGCIVSSPKAKQLHSWFHFNIIHVNEATSKHSKTSSLNSKSKRKKITEKNQIDERLESCWYSRRPSVCGCRNGNRERLASRSIAKNKPISYMNRLESRRSIKHSTCVIDIKQRSREWEKVKQSWRNKLFFFILVLKTTSYSNHHERTLILDSIIEVFWFSKFKIHRSICERNENLRISNQPLYCWATTSERSFNFHMICVCDCKLEIETR
jgi:hypothetical protein